jgi:hypothetical protein
VHGQQPALEPTERHDLAAEVLGVAYITSLLRLRVGEAHCAASGPLAGSQPAKLGRGITAGIAAAGNAQQRRVTTFATAHQLGGKPLLAAQRSGVTALPGRAIDHMPGGQH